MIALDESSKDQQTKNGQRATDCSKLGADLKFQIMSLHDPTLKNNNFWTELQLC